MQQSKHDFIELINHFLQNMCIHFSLFLSLPLHTHAHHTHAHIYTCTHTYMHMYMWMYVYVCMISDIYTHMCIYVLKYFVIKCFPLFLLLLRASCSKSIEFSWLITTWLKWMDGLYKFASLSKVAVYWNYSLLIGSEDIVGGSKEQTLKLQ